jgi:hypothetical protein
MLTAEPAEERRTRKEKVEGASMVGMDRKESRVVKVRAENVRRGGTQAHEVAIGARRVVGVGAGVD